MNAIKKTASATKSTNKTPVTKTPTSAKAPAKKSGGDEEKTARARKTYEKPGQKHDVPDELDCQRLFYESLLKQNPQSAMAEKYCLEYGLLSLERAQQAISRPNNKSGAKPSSSAVKSPAKPSASSAKVKSEVASPKPVKPAKKPTIVDDDD
jgi:hypothetical protein